MKLLTRLSIAAVLALVPLTARAQTSTLNLPDLSGGSDTAVGKATTDTLTNKTISSGTYSGQIVFSSSISPTALSGDVNDYNPTGNSTAFRLSVDAGAANRNVTGLVGCTSAGITKIIYNGGAANNLVIKDESTSSSATNRFHTGGNDITVAPGKARTFICDTGISGGRWTNYDAALGNTGVTAGSYTNTNITVGTDGRISAASNGTATSVGQILSGELAAQAQALTKYYFPSAYSASACSSTTSPACHVTEFTTATWAFNTCEATNAPSGAQTFTYTLYDNGSATSATCTITGSATTSTGAGTASIVAGHQVSVQLVTSATAVSTGISTWALSRQ